MYRLEVWLICVLMLTSCYRSDPWCNVSIKTGSDAFNSSKLIYPATHFLHDLELEFLYAEEQLSAYINVYAEVVPPYEGDEKMALLIINTGGKSQRIVVDRLSGGQRLRIPDSMLMTLIHAFNSYSSVTLKLDELYTTTINTKDFKKHFEKLHIKPFAFLSNNPIGLAL